MPLVLSKSARPNRRRPRPALARAAAGAVLLAGLSLALRTAEGASTGTTQLFTPAAGGSAASSGKTIGDFVSTFDGLNTFYSYFVEVPSGLSHLVIQIFDADSANAVETGGRDRARTNNNNAASTHYLLFDPTGTERPAFLSPGTATGPTGADNGWLDLYNILSGGTGKNNLDQFGGAAYNNSNGNTAWGGNWTEANDNNNAGTGMILITGGELSISDNNDGNPSTITRAAANMTTGGWVNAVLSFSFRTSNTAVAGTDRMRVEVSSNGGGAWTTLETFDGPFVTAQTRAYNITSFKGATTQIRFIRNIGYNGRTFFVDNVQIEDPTLPNGHWEIRVDSSTAFSTGDDINAIGIRANDGDATAGGTELNAYYDSFTSYGVNDATADRTYVNYPYVATGCTVEVNDFDGDDSGSFSVKSPGNVTFNGTGISTNNAWRNEAFSFTTDNNATDYGIWTLNFVASAAAPVPAGSGNYYTVFLANSLAANPVTTAPTTQPTPNSFRVYLPTDAGGAPVKPYLEQQARQGSIGPNPPTAGQTSRVEVTIRVVNPTASAITFSAANLVTANVPGAGVVYAGNAAVTQGTITGQPTVGSTGDITWNPGTVAANTTAILAYQVNVTPTSAGQRLPVVATPASGNGTRGVFIDETGNATQARAKMTAGPLCELAVTADILTPAVVSGLTASATRAGTLLSWDTATEVGTVGFDVYRLNDATRKFERLNGRLLPALIAAPQGGHYRYLDATARQGGNLTYRIEEVSAQGERRQHGPFVVSARATGEAPPTGGYERQAWSPAAAPREETRSADAKALATSDALKIGVDSPGIYTVSADTIAAQMGLKANKTREMLQRRGFILTLRGQTVPWMPLANGDGLIFFGQGLSGVYSHDNVYWLRQGLGAVMASTGVVAPSSTPANAAYDSTVHAESDRLAATVVSTDPDSDYWYWDFLIAADPTDGTKSFPVTAPGASPLGTGNLRLRLKGASAAGAPTDHHAVVRVNGIAVGETSWTGLATQTVDLPLGAGIVRDGANTVEVEAALDPGVPYSIFYVDSFDLSYTRFYHAVGNALSFHGAGNASLAVDNFSSAAISVFEVTDPQHPRLVTGPAVTGSTTFQVALTPASPGTEYLAVTPAAYKAPHWLEADRASNLRAGNASYLVLTTRDLVPAAQQLADLRTRQGLTAEVVDVTDIMDEWNDGIFSPYAIRDFLAYRYARGARYAVLAGNGNFDYRNNLGLGGDLVPPLMVSTANGLFASDNRLGDVVGNDGVPELAIGRIPVSTAADLSAYVQKVAAYEAEPVGPWSGRAIMMSDDPEGGASFRNESEHISAALPVGVTAEPLSLATTPLTTARSTLFSALAQGIGFVSYVGHGGLDRLASEGLLLSTDIPTLPSSTRVPIVAAMTCTINRFEIPGFTPLGAQLTNRAAGGALAVFAPTGLSFNAATSDLGDRFFRNMDLAHGQRLGDAVNRALASYHAIGNQANLVDVYTLLGDPALLLKAAPPAPPQPGGTGD